MVLERQGDGGGMVRVSEKERGRESLRHPLVSLGTFLCTRNDCTQSWMRIGKEEGEVSFLKRLNEREGKRMHTWSKI